MATEEDKKNNIPLNRDDRQILDDNKHLLIDFHHIGKVVVRKRKRGWLPLLLALVFLGYGIWLLVDAYYGGNQASLAVASISLSLIILLCFFFPGQKYLYLWSEKYAVSIKFWDNNPSEEDLLTFIAHINKAQRIRLQQLHLTIDMNMSYEQYRKNIQWLWDNEFLSQKEAEQRLGEMNSNFT